MTLALYRAYRPGTLAEVVGQEHVTAPLRRALLTGRLHHAYLFSGPRGCGKTSTARILARSLNCVEGPTPDPCGVCDNCIALAPNGLGSPDVIELDAASHGGVDDTRELRERVVYSPAQSRYRIYIIDEAHMVTTQGFNALLKVIEEPPEYVRFIFATTEPEKVLGTIRSRTFNYAFRLVSVKVLSAHLASVCDAEGVPFETAALALIARAGGGSVRDALSILGQLIAGSGEDGLTTSYVATGLGRTDDVLLDRVLASIADRDGAAIFTAVDDVIEAGHDGRQFLTDLLERLRNLIIAQHVSGEALADLLQLPADQIDGLRGQAEAFGPAELSRAADLVSVGLSELKGATAPRLQLELVLARLLLPASDDLGAGVAARLDRLERAATSQVVQLPPASAPQRSAPPAPPSPKPAPAAQQPETKPPARPPGRRTSPPRLSDLAPATVTAPTPPASSSPRQQQGDLAAIRERWDDALAELGKRSRVAWALWDSSLPTALDAGSLTVTVSDQGRLSSIKASRREELLRQVLIDVMRVDVKVVPVLAAVAPAADADIGAASPDDPDADSPGVSGVDLLIREFGAVPIGEIGEA